MAPEQTTGQRLASGRQTGNRDRPYGRVPVPGAAGIRLGFAVESAVVAFDKGPDEWSSIQGASVGAGICGVLPSWR